MMQYQVTYTRTLTETRIAYIDAEKIEDIPSIISDREYQDIQNDECEPIDDICEVLKIEAWNTLD